MSARNVRMEDVRKSPSVGTHPGATDVIVILDSRKLEQIHMENASVSCNFL